MASSWRFIRIGLDWLGAQAAATELLFDCFYFTHSSIIAQMQTFLSDVRTPHDTGGTIRSVQYNQCASAREPDALKRHLPLPGKRLPLSELLPQDLEHLARGLVRRSRTSPLSLQKSMFPPSSLTMWNCGSCVRPLLHCIVLQGYRVVVRRLQLESCCDYVIIRGGSTGQPEYRFPKHRRTNSSEELNSHSDGVGDVLEFSDPFITITVYTDQSITK